MYSPVTIDGKTYNHALITGVQMYSKADSERYTIVGAVTGSTDADVWKYINSQTIVALKYNQEYQSGWYSIYNEPTGIYGFDFNPNLEVLVRDLTALVHVQGKAGIVSIDLVLQSQEVPSWKRFYIAHSSVLAIESFRTNITNDAGQTCLIEYGYDGCLYINTLEVKNMIESSFRASIPIIVNRVIS